MRLRKSERQYVSRRSPNPGVPWPELDDENRYKPSDALAASLVGCIPKDGKEHTLVVAYDTALKPLAWEIVATGTVDSTPLYPRDIYGWAIQQPLARYVGLAHNHPSGDVTPSGPDKRGTHIVAGVGKALGLDLIYSMVVTHEGPEWEHIKPLMLRQPQGDDAQPQRPDDNPQEPYSPEDDGPGDEDDQGNQGGEDEPDPSPSDDEGDEPPADERIPDAGEADMDELRKAVGRVLGR
jgi:hypothetical protein